MKFLILATFFILLNQAKANELNLFQKLDHEWLLYKKAQDFLVKSINQTNVPLNKRVVDRKTWEKLITPENEWIFTETDIHQLQVMHQNLINISRQQNKLKSTIDFDSWRSNDLLTKTAKIKTFCAEVPKGGMLHIHPSGTFKRPIMSELMIEKNPSLPIHDFIRDLDGVSDPTAYLYPAELSFLRTLIDQSPYLNLTLAEQNSFLDLMFLPKGNHPFERFEAVFYFTGMQIESYNDYQKALWDFLVNASKSHVLYIEFTAGISNKSLEFYKKLAADAKRLLGITLRVNVSFYRLLPNEALESLAKNALALNNDLITGIDLLGNEERASALEGGQIPYAMFLNAKNSGVYAWNFTQHAGELGDPRNPRDAMIMGATRLGHGTKLINDPIALEYARQHNVAVEINLTSNIRLRGIDTIENHPFLKYLRLGLPVSLSTDDEGIFETDINQECELALSYTDISYFEFKKMSYNSIRTSFVKDDEKKILLQKLDKEFYFFESAQK